MNQTCENPKGYEFYDIKSQRIMMIIYEGEWKDWIAYKHPDGQWVSLRKATNDDWHKLARAMSKALHAR
jgi:hypothetical protein